MVPMDSLVLGVLAGDTTGYRLLVLAHLLCVVVGFGSTFVYPFLGAQSKKRRGPEGAAISDATLATAKIVTTPKRAARPRVATAASCTCSSWSSWF